MKQNLRTRIIRHIRANMPVMVLGPPGVGKSAVFAEIAAENKMQFIDFRASDRSPVDFNVA